MTRYQAPLFMPTAGNPWAMVRYLDVVFSIEGLRRGFCSGFPALACAPEAWAEGWL